MSEMASAAIVTIRHASDMTTLGRKTVARWLRDQAEFLEEFGNEYSTTFQARYMCKSKPRKKRKKKRKAGY